MKNKIVFFLVVLVSTVVYGQELQLDDSAIVFNPRPENISLLRLTPPQYKFYVTTPKSSGKVQADMEQRYRASQASNQTPQAGDMGRGAKARQEGYEQRKGDAKASRNIN